MFFSDIKRHSFVDFENTLDALTPLQGDLKKLLLRWSAPGCRQPLRLGGTVGSAENPAKKSGPDPNACIESERSTTKRVRKKRTAICRTVIFFHPDCNCWSRSCTESADALLRPVADFTASGELHPALKTKYSVVFLLTVYAVCYKNATLNLRK